MELTAIAEQFHHIHSTQSLLFTVNELRNQLSKENSKVNLLSLDVSEASHFMIDLFSNVVLFHISSDTYVTLCDCFLLPEKTTDSLNRYCLNHLIRYYHYTKNHYKLTEFLSFLMQTNTPNISTLLEEAMTCLTTEDALHLQEVLAYYFVS